MYSKSSSSIWTVLSTLSKESKIEILQFIVAEIVQALMQSLVTHVISIAFLFSFHIIVLSF